MAEPEPELKSKQLSFLENYTANTFRDLGLDLNCQSNLKVSQNHPNAQKKTKYYTMKKEKKGMAFKSLTEDTTQKQSVFNLNLPQVRKSTFKNFARIKVQELDSDDSESECNSIELIDFSTKPQRILQLHKVQKLSPRKVPSEESKQTSQESIYSNSNSFSPPKSGVYQIPCKIQKQYQKQTKKQTKKQNKNQKIQNENLLVKLTLLRKPVVEEESKEDCFFNKQFKQFTTMKKSQCCAYSSEWSQIEAPSYTSENYDHDSIEEEVLAFLSNKGVKMVRPDEKKSEYFDNKRSQLFLNRFNSMNRPTDFMQPGFLQRRKNLKSNKNDQEKLEKQN